MNREEARIILEKMRSPKYAVRYGFLCGASVMLCLLSFSFVQPHLEYIMVMSIYPIIISGLYVLSLALKFRKAKKLLRDPRDVNK